MGDANSMPEIPKTCKAGCVVNEGPDFRVEVEDVPVPEPGKPFHLVKGSSHYIARPRPSSSSTQCHGNLLFRSTLYDERSRLLTNVKLRCPLSRP